MQILVKGLRSEHAMDLFSLRQKLDSYKLLVHWYAWDEYSTLGKMVQYEYEYKYR